jgi:hypothetical protein
MMAITTRVLPEAEWPRLKTTGCEVRQAFKGGAYGGCVLVAENEVGDIVGTLFVTVSPRLDGLWIHPEYRHGSAFRRLGRHAMRVVQQLGATQVFAPIANQALGRWLSKRLKAQSVTEEMLFRVVTHG